MTKLVQFAGFKAFLIIVFLNILVDFGYKISIENILIKSYEGKELFIYLSLTQVMMILPFVAFLSPIAYFNDRFHKTHVIRIASIVKLSIAGLITFSYALGFFWFSFFLTFLLSVQSAAFSPAKYAMIKYLSDTNSLSLANAIVQALSALAILIASLGFSWIFQGLFTQGYTNEQMPKLVWVSLILVFFCALELWSAFSLPDFDEKKHISYTFDYKQYLSFKYFKNNMLLLKSNKDIYLSVVGLCIFWGVGALLLFAFPAHYKHMHQSEDNFIIQSILAVSILGVFLGSYIAALMSRNHIELGIIPIGALGLCVSLFFLASFSDKIALMLSSIAFGFFGALLLVVLNSIILYFAKNSLLGHIQASSNFAQSFVMLTFWLLSVIFVLLDLPTGDLILFACFIALFGGLYAIAQVPHLFARLLLIPILKARYHLYVEGLKNLPEHGGVLLLGNHISWVDWIILQIASPRAIKFVMQRRIYERPFLRYFLRFFKVIPIGLGNNKESLRLIHQRLKNGEVVAIFPEGHISFNGQLNEFKRGFEIALKDTNALIVPFYLRGLWGTNFSRAAKYYQELTKVKKREIIVAFGKALPNTTSANEVRQKVLELSFSSWERFISTQNPLTYHWLNTAKSNLRKICLVDELSGEMSNGKFLTAVLIFLRVFKKELQHEKNIGIILPSSSIATIINMAIFCMGKVPINLNYTLDANSLDLVVKKANINFIISSEKFIDKLSNKGFNLSENLKQKLILAENLKQKISTFLKISSLMQAYLLPKWYLKFAYIYPSKLSDTATILFSSGSEGEPKGIELSHKNLLTNIKQISELLNFRPNDCMLNSLPIFHSFGLTVCTLMPIVEGVKAVSVPDPTDGLAIGRACAYYRATFLFGTSTFYRLYNRNKKLHPLMFASLRLVIAGAEKLQSHVKEAFRLKFGIEIYEGYGTTETAPVVSVNIPNILEPENLSELTFNRPGSVGLPLPGTIVKIVDPDTLEELPFGKSGLILIGGGQVMKGYLNDEEKTNEVIIKQGDTRYYKTGDKGFMDESGFIFIVDRYSRFAKIGGEMISLGAIQEQLGRVLGDEVQFVAINVPDEKKGEAVVLLIKTELNKEEIKQRINLANLSPLMTPSKVFFIEDFPLLGSGKVDFKNAKKIGEELYNG